MNAGNWMTRSVQTCRPETGMHEVAHGIQTGDFGVLPVVDGEGRVVGTITTGQPVMAR
jgi:CBS domain-containing protein